MHPAEHVSDPSHAGHPRELHPRGQTGQHASHPSHGDGDGDADAREASEEGVEGVVVVVAGELLAASVGGGDGVGAARVAGDALVGGLMGMSAV